MEGLDPDVVDGRVGRDVNWIRTLLLLIVPISVVVGYWTLLLIVPIGVVVGYWTLLLIVPDWKGWIWTSIRRVGSGRQLEGDWKGWSQTLLLEGTFLLIVPIDAVVVDCSDWRCSWTLLLIVLIDIVVDCSNQR